MTNEQINIAIAKACGWQVNKHKYLAKPPNGDWQYKDELPDYCNCLNAMHEAEKVLTTKQKQRFATALSDTLSDSAPTESCHTVWSDTIHATSRQRAEAFLKTLGKWEETK